MLVVDRVELHVLNLAREVWELDRRDAARSEQHGHTADEIVQIRHVGEHVFRDDQIGRAMRCAQAFRGLDPEKRNVGRHAFGDGDRRDVGGRLDAEYRDAGREEILQQVSVVTRKLDNERGRIEAFALDGKLDVALGMREPRVGIRRKIGVVAEDRFGGFERFKLDQKTTLADERVQRIGRLHLAQLRFTAITVRERRHAEVAKRARERGGAGTAKAWCHRFIS